MGAARPGELPPPLSCAVFPESGQWGPRLEREKRRKAKSSYKFPRLRGRPGWCPARRYLRAGQPVRAPLGAEAAPSLRRALLAAVRGSSVSLLQCPGSRARLWPWPGRGGSEGRSRLPPPSRPPARGLGPGPSLGLLPPSADPANPANPVNPLPGLPTPACRVPRSSGLSPAALLEVWWLFVAVSSVRGTER